jgi:hypothetical protein
MATLAISGTDWTAIGSVATAIAAAVALVSLFYARRRQVADEAALIREQIRTFATRVQRAVGEIEGGSARVSAAWHAATSLRDQVGSRPTADDVRACIGNPAVARIASVQGWETSSFAAESRSQLSGLTGADRELRGHLGLFAPAAELLQRLADDGYSASVFVKLLTGEPAAKFVESHTDDDLDALTRSLARHLDANAELYFDMRYASSVSRLERFVDRAASAFIELEPAALVLAARARLPSGTEPTLTAQLRARVKGLTGLLGQQLVDQLLDYVQQVEVSITKEAAEQRLADVSELP